MEDRRGKASGSGGTVDSPVFFALWLPKHKAMKTLKPSIRTPLFAYRRIHLPKKAAIRDRLILRLIEVFEWARVSKERKPGI